MKVLWFAFATVTLIATPPLLAQSGGTFNITQSVIAGGSNSSAGTYSLTGTSGQPFAGTTSSGGIFRAQGGFWQPLPSAPTAALVTIMGRVRTSDGRGIRNAILKLMAPDGSTHTAITGPLGYYKFDDVEAGKSYVLSIESQRFQFGESSRIVFANDSIADADFIAME